MICSNMAYFPADQSIFPTHGATHQDFLGVSLELKTRSMSFSGVERQQDQEVQVEDDMSDDGSQLALGEKKRRLNLEQVKALEKSFELGNKLEPERKIQLAKALGLQPRQVAIWFQNRRARWKTKQLEKDYEILKTQFETLKSDNHVLKSQNRELQAELLALKGGESIGVRPINLTVEIEGSWSNVNESNGNVNISATRTPSTASQVYSQMSNKHLFASSISATSSTHLPSSSRQDFQYQKVDQTVADECFSHMFSGIDDQPAGFWPWPEQQHFH